MEFDFSPLNENTELRDNILNAEIGDIDVFSKLNAETSQALIKAVNGFGFDANGNVIGADGKVLANAADVRTKLRDHYSNLNDVNPLDYESVTVDGVAYTINDKGEAVDATGKVVKTTAEVKQLLKDALVKDAEPTDMASIIAAANTNLGLEFKDENGAIINFEPTLAGMQARDQYIIDNLVTKLTQEAVTNVLASDNDIESLYLYKQQHGTSVGWTPTPDYGQIVLLKPTDANAETQYRDLIIKAQIASGQNPEMAKTLAQYLIDDGKGEEMAKQSLTTLKAAEDKKIADAREANAKAAQEEQARVEQYWNDIKTTIDKGSVNGVTIPAFITIKQSDGTTKTVPRSYLFEYMSKPVENGRSALQLYNQKMTNEARVLEALMKLTNYGYGDIVKASVATSKVEAIRRVKSGNPAGNNKPNNAGGKAPVDLVVL